MASNMRWRYGDLNPVVAAVDAATTIEIGDLLFQNTDDARPASAQADQGSESVNQQLFARNFLGVAMQRSRAGKPGEIRVATTGIFEFDCPLGTFELGDLVGPQENSPGTALENQTLIKVSDPRYAIGRVVKRADFAAVSVLVDIRSTVLTGGVLGSWPGSL